ncbi:Chromatin organization modifier domain-containing protein [Phanerochaete sordida]|uniref:Chromatin organization modifier domain-containing protein n=1 Tax=Phanerochaete sordida TaxID=48140 RepID=A0A9P3LA42_9APHY|nr:Chromatin organization modifier domain-containing protein [Phanerochaete sordida]
MVKKKRHTEEEEQYHVEVITKARVNSEGNWDYYVKWAGYGPEADSWEPTENVEGCERLLKSFWNHIGLDNEDYEEGYVVEASPKWIEDEKAFFHEHFGRPESAHKKKRRDSKAQKPVIGKAITKKNAKGKITLKKPQIQDSDSDYEESSSEDDVPVSIKSKGAKRIRRSDSPSDSEDSDVPLRKAPRKSSSGTAKPSKQGSVSLAKSVKGKEVARPRPRPSTPEHDPLFSEPSSPEVQSNKKKLSEPTAGNSTSQAAASAAGAQRNTVAVQPPPQRQPAPSHKNQQPKVKMMELPLTSDAANFTETKRRIAARTGAVPKPAPPPAPAPDMAKKDSLKGLSFKKNKSTTDAAKPSLSVIPQAGPSQDPRRPAAGGSWIQDTRIVDSPVSEHNASWGAAGTWSRAQSPGTASTLGNTAGAGSGDWDAPRQASPATAFAPAGPTPHVDRPPDPRKVAMARRQSTPQEPRRTEVDDFLASVMPAQLAAPMHEPTGDAMDVDVPAIPKSIIKKPLLPQTRIPKKWQWEGELRMRTGPDEPEPPTKLCGITLSEPSEPRPNGLRLNLCYTAQTSTIRLEKLHYANDVYMLLRACAPIQQYCKVTPQAADDERTFKTFSTFLGQRRQFTYARAHMDDNQVGVLLFVPAVAFDLCKVLKIPLEFRDQSIIAVLIPWRLTPGQYHSYDWQASYDRLGADDGHIAPELADKLLDFGKKITSDLRLAQGLRLHHFTAADRDFFTRSLPRKYRVWHAPLDGTTGRPGFETQLLHAVLKHWEAVNATVQKDLRAIFVHVGALHTLHNLDALAGWRCKRPDLRFYTYGTHPTIPPHRWGVREIYPVGGVVTFSAKAIIEDPFKVCDLIEQLHQHPLWVCYIHPFVLAAVAKTSYPGSDPGSLVRQDNFFYRPLLDLIDDGRIALLEAPPKSRQPKTAPNDTSRMVEPAIQWTEWCIGLCELDAAGIVEECMRYLEGKHAELPQKDLLPVADRLLIEDLLQMQLEPAMMDEYRRYVMVTETRNGQPKEQGVEFFPISQDFEFRDNYFSNP